MKKKILLFSAIACFSVGQAQTVWQDKFELPRDAVKEVLAATTINNDIAVSTLTGEVYVAGTFDKEFSFGGTDLTPIAKSTYLVKYSATGGKDWAVSLAGAATPTAITTAKNGDVYIAGNLADVVIFGSTDGASQEADGVKLDGSYIVSQSAAFIAQYSSAGVLLKVETYKPEALDGIEPDFSNDGVKLEITSLQQNENKLYATVLMKGAYSANGFVIEGGQFLAFGFWPMDVRTGYLISFDSNLALSGVVAGLKTADSQDINCDVQSIQFDIVDGLVYVGFDAIGKQDLKVGGETTPIQFSVIPGEETKYAKGFVVINVDLATGKLKNNVLFENKPTDEYNTQLGLNSLTKIADKLVLSGSFGKELPFDNTVLAQDTANIFVATLDLNTLNVNSTFVDLQKGQNVASATAIVGNRVYVGAIASRNARSSRLYEVDFIENKASSSLLSNSYLNYLTVSGANLVSVFTNLDAALPEFIIKVEKPATSGIENNQLDDLVKVYPNPVTDVLYFSETANVEVYSVVGSLVLSAKSVDQLDVQSLVSGIYVAKVKIGGAIKTVTVIKK